MVNLEVVRTFTITVDEGTIYRLYTYLAEGLFRDKENTVPEERLVELAQLKEDLRKQLFPTHTGGSRW